MKFFGKSIRDLLGFNDLKLRLIGILSVGLIMPMAFFQSFPWNGLTQYLGDVLGSMIYTTIYWHVDRLVIAYYRGKLPSLNDYRRRVLYQSLWIVFFTMTLCTGIGWLTELFIPANPNKPSEFQLNLASLVITVAIASIYEAIYSVNKWKSSFIESERLKKESMQAQLETLKNQVNPHFLFNSLNAVTSMVHDQPDEAVEFIQKLSKVYRYILEIKNKEMITLREEMECIHAYQFLLKMRFGENVQFNIDIPEEEMQCHIVPLSLQILLENAIKHNVISTNKPLHIDIQMGRNGNLVVRNNLQKKSMVNGSTKTGIANIQSRYKLLTDKEVDVIVTKEHFTVSVPLIHIENYETAYH